MTVFVGGGGVSANAAPNIRRSIRLECDNATLADQNLPYGYGTLCAVVDCSNGVCEHDPIRYIYICNITTILFPISILILIHLDLSFVVGSGS